MNDSKMANNLKSSETRTTGMAYLLWCSTFVGVCGLHRFYAGKYITGALWLATGGLLGVGQFLDLLFIPGMVETKNLKTLKKQLNSGDFYQQFPQQQIVRNLETNPPKSDKQIILQLAKKNPEGISVVDAVIATDKPVDEMKQLLIDLYKQELLEMDNHPETGIIIYKIAG